MGRIKTTQVKRIGKQLILEHKESFKKDFAANKAIVERFVHIPSKKLRNVVTGYVTRLMKQQS